MDAKASVFRDGNLVLPFPFLYTMVYNRVKKNRASALLSRSPGLMEKSGLYLRVYDSEPLIYREGTVEYRKEGTREA